MNLSEEYWAIEDYSQSYESKGKVRWIWKKGLSLEKTIVVTSVMISTAPIVLPPLIIISAFGFACSLPVGFAIVTYASTTKLIDYLLPMPSHPPLLEHGTMYYNKEEYKAVDDVEKGYEDDDIEADEEGFEEDINNEVDMRIELVEEENNGPDDYNKDEVDIGEQVDEIIEEEGYEEDVEENILDNEEQPLNSNAIPVILEGIREADDEISMMESERDEMQTNSLQAVVVEAEVGGEDENNVEQVLEEMIVLEPQSEKEEDGHTEMCSGIKEEMRRETTGVIEEMRDGSEEIEGSSVKDMPQNDESRELFVIPEEAKPTDRNGEVINARKMNDISSNASNHAVNERIIKQDESVSSQAAEATPVVEKKFVVHVKTVGDHTITDVRQGGDSDRERGTLILSDADAREMADESGFDLFDHDSTESDQITMLANDSFAEEEPYSADLIDVNVDYHEVLVAYEVSEPKGDKTASYHGTKEGFNKESASEEKIWEQIKAMKSIVGYKETPHSSCLDELKALYVFTGVEPPASFEKPADISDMNEKLHFLMAIIGVK